MDLLTSSLVKLSRSLEIIQCYWNIICGYGSKISFFIKYNIKWALAGLYTHAIFNGKKFWRLFPIFVSSPFYFLLVYFNNQKSLWLATEHLQQPLLILVSSRNTKQTFLPHHGKEWIVGKAAQSCTWGDPLRWNGEPLNPPNKANYLKTQKRRTLLVPSPREY